MPPPATYCLGQARSSASPSLRRTSRMERNGYTVADVIEENVDALGDKVAIKYVNDGSVLTFKQLDQGASCPWPFPTAPCCRCSCVPVGCPFAPRSRQPCGKRGSAHLNVPPRFLVSLVA